MSDEGFITFGSPIIDAEAVAAVTRTLESCWIGTGPRVHELESEFARYVGATHALATSSCTAALHLAMVATGIGPGDEVITTPMTFCATANSIVHTGATPVFADCRRDTMNIDPAAVEAAVTPRTKAIIPVHFAGRPVDMEAILAIAKRHGLLVIEDAAHAIESATRGRKVGSIGDVTCFSFYVTKNMTTGEGGMVTTADSDLAERIRLLREHGMKVRYHHDVLGYNFRMTDLAAAIGLAQLPKLAGFNDRRRAIAARYDAELQGVITPRVRPGVTHVYHQYTILVAGRDAFAERLAERGVGSAIYYPIPVHRQKPFIELGYGDERFPVTERLTDQVLSIPVHPSLTDDEVATVIGAVNETAAEFGPLEAAAAG